MNTRKYDFTASYLSCLTIEYLPVRSLLMTTLRQATNDSRAIQAACIVNSYFLNIRTNIPHP